VEGICRGTELLLQQLRSRTKLLQGSQIPKATIFNIHRRSISTWSRGVSEAGACSIFSLYTFISKLTTCSPNFRLFPEAVTFNPFPTRAGRRHRHQHPWASARQLNGYRIQEDRFYGVHHVPSFLSFKQNGNVIMRRSRAGSLADIPARSTPRETFRT
jgi:hypothetical protein